MSVGLQRVPEDLTDRRGVGAEDRDDTARHLRLDQIHALEDPLAREVEVGSVLVDDVDHGEAERRRGPHRPHPGQPTQIDHHGVGDLVLHLLRRASRPLGEHDDLRLREIGNGIDRVGARGVDPRRHHQRHHREHEEAIAQRGVDQPRDHSASPRPSGAAALRTSEAPPHCTEAPVWSCDCESTRKLAAATTSSPSRETLDHLHQVAGALADPHLPPGEARVAGLHVDDLAGAGIEQRAARHHQPLTEVHLQVGVSEHARLQRALGIGELDAHPRRTGGGIDHRVDEAHATFELAPGHGVQSGGRLLPQAHRAEVGLVDPGLEPDPRQVGEQVEILPFGHVLAGDGELLEHRPRDGGPHDQRRLDVAALLEARDLIVIDSPQAQPIARRLDQGLGGGRIARGSARLRPREVVEGEQELALRCHQLGAEDGVDRRAATDLLAGEVEVETLEPSGDARRDARHARLVGLDRSGRANLTSQRLALGWDRGDSGRLHGCGREIHGAALDLAFTKRRA